MPSKVQTKRAAMAASPMIDVFVSEDVRQESDGKVTMVGMFPDRVVVAQVPPDAPAPDAAHPLLIDSLAFLVCVRGLVGSHEIVIRVGDSPAVEASSNLPRQVDFPSTGEGINFIVKMRPALVLSYGVKNILVFIDGVEHKGSFEIRKRIVPPHPVAATPIARAPAPRARMAPVKKTTSE